MNDVRSHATGLVVFSHLRWDFVFQRPQQLLSRFAEHRHVTFIEEPVHDANCEAYLEQVVVSEQLVVLRPHTPLSSAGFAEDQLPIVQRLLNEYFQQFSEPYVAWFYTPLALPLLTVVPTCLIVYDCMDALDAFLHAPPLLKKREQDLLAVADLVFTGGLSLYERLEGRHASVHCFPSSVDASHFGRALTSTVEPTDQRALARPRLGYFGVIDERIDLELIDYLANFDPTWQIVMVGPVVKIEESTLPRRENIHFLGQKAYTDLPAYLAGWDVCLLPFAINASTKYISPTKTLEYMAADKKIVSTPVTDVLKPYSHIVSVQESHESFACSCRELLAEQPQVTSKRAETMRSVLSATSWDLTTEQMARLVDEAIARKPRVAGAAFQATRTVRPVVVIGAGPTGLSAAYHLGKSATLVEQSKSIGGWCRSLTSDGFTFDFAGHIMFSKEPYVHELYEMLLGENVHWQNREAWIYSKQTYTRYPFQASLYGLPADVIKECIIGAVEAKYGSPTTAPNQPADNLSDSVKAPPNVAQRTAAIPSLHC